MASRWLLGVLVLLIASSGIPSAAYAQAYIPAWWPCPSSGAPSKDVSLLMSRMLPTMEETDRGIKAPPGSSRALFDKTACNAERDPKLAAEMAETFHYPANWATPAYKAAAAASAVRSLVASSSPPLAPPSERPWFSFARNGCQELLSPAERIRIIQDAGVIPETRDYGPKDDPTKVEVSIRWGDTYTFWRSKQECEAAMPRNQSVPSRYN